MTFLPGLFFAFLGALLGSFAGVISERIGTGQSWVRGHSLCNSCSEKLTWRDLVPIVSWTLAGGRCRTCKARIPYLYSLTELTLGTLFFAGYTEFGISLEFLVLDAFLFLATIMVLYDLRHTIVPFKLSIGLIVIGALFAFLHAHGIRDFALVLLESGAIALGFFLLHVLSQGRWMGLGDAPVALAFSLLAGPTALAGLLFSFWIGAAIGVLILAMTPRGHRINSEVPFVPFLAAGYLLALFTQWNPLMLLN